MKTCCYCKIDKPLEDFHKDSNKKYGVKSSCKRCSKLYNRKWIKTEQGKKTMSIATKNWKKSEKGKAYKRRKNRERGRVRDVKARLNLTDRIVKKELKKEGWPVEHITNELIETKRIIIKIKRACKE